MADAPPGGLPLPTPGGPFPHDEDGHGSSIFNAPGVNRPTASLQSNAPGEGPGNVPFTPATPPAPKPGVPQPKSGPSNKPGMPPGLPGNRKPGY